MLKKIFILSLVLFSLYSCSQDETTNENNSGLILNEQDNFSLFIPSNWSILSGSLLENLPSPAIGEISFVSSSVDTIDGFSNNLIVLKQNLASTMSSYDYSILNNPSLKKDFSYFKIISEKDISFDNDKAITSKMYIYEAKYSKQTPNLHFLQTAVVCGDTGYLITIGLTKNNSSFTKYENILKTFSCK